MPLYTLADWWVSRRAKADKHAHAEILGRQPAVVVTGASRGIGFAIAQRFLEAGHNVVLVARNQAGLHKAKERMKGARDDSVITFSYDATHANFASALERILVDKKVYLDVLINNAGAGISGAVADNAPDEIERLLTLNVTALTRLMRHFLPQLLARGRGGIINIASLGGPVPGPNQAVYYASKAYVLSLSEAAASESAGRGIRICAVAPGPVATTFHARMGADNSFYRWVVPALTPGAVANATYRGFRLGHRVIVPGMINALFYLAIRFLPHRITVPLVGLLLRRRER